MKSRTQNYSNDQQEIDQQFSKDFNLKDSDGQLKEKISVLEEKKMLENENKEIREQLKVIQIEQDGIISENRYLLKENSEMRDAYKTIEKQYRDTVKENEELKKKQLEFEQIQKKLLDILQPNLREKDGRDNPINNTNSEQQQKQGQPKTQLNKISGSVQARQVLKFGFRFGNKNVQEHYKIGNQNYDKGEYVKALEQYEQCNTEKMFIKLKCIGNCYRKMGQLDLSIQNYSKALDELNNSEKDDFEKSSIYNNRGLSYLEQAEKQNSPDFYQKAISDFTEALNIQNLNPLFECNLGYALYVSGNKKKGIEHLKNAQDNLQSIKVEEETDLTQKNIEYIKTILKSVVLNIEKIEETRLDEQDSVLDMRTNALARFAAHIHEITNENIINDLGQRIINAKNNLQQVINKDINLKRFYDGFLNTFCNSYAFSQTIQSDQIQLNSKGTNIDIFSVFSSFIPFAGSAISQGLEQLSTFIEDVKIKKSAVNVNCLATTKQQFEEIAQDVTIQIIILQQKILSKIDPEKIILPNWANRFQWIYQKTQQMKIEIYGVRYKTSFSKFGNKLANQVIAQYISSGLIYEGFEDPADMNDNQKIDKLKEYAIKELNEDLNILQIKDSITTVKESSACCTIF